MNALGPNLPDLLAAEWEQQDLIVAHYERLARQARVSRIADTLSDPRFMLGVFVGTWVTVGAAFGIAFL